MMQTKSKQASKQLKKNAAGSHDDSKSARTTMVDNRSATALQRQLRDGIDARPDALAQRRVQADLHSSPAMASQRRQLDGRFGEPVQKVGPEEEELLQGRFDTLQRQAGLEDEELLQGRFDALQRQEDLEEDELLQGKFDTLQCQEGLEDEELLQGRFDTLQRQEDLEEEELLQGKFDTLQRQQDLEDEELLQGKFEPIQAQMPEEEEPLQGRFTDAGASIQRQEQSAMAENKTGMPGPLKAGVESLSGMDMSDVRVHYNSSKPAQLNALAYAQGADIHLGSGQEKHLPHEAWHVVQQKQGRVQPTLQMQGGVKVNDDAALEKEADVMGERALQAKLETNKASIKRSVPLIAQRTVEYKGTDVDEKELNNKQLQELKDLYGSVKNFDADELKKVIDEQKRRKVAAPGELGLEQLHEEKERTKNLEGFERFLDINKEIKERKSTSAKGALEDWAWHAYSQRQALIASIQSELNSATPGDLDVAIAKIKKVLYDYYSAYSGGEALPPNQYKGFIEKLKQIEDAGNQGKGFVVYPQNRKLERGVTIAKENAMARCVQDYATYKDKLDNMFAYRVYAGSETNPQKQRGSTKSRITLRLNPEKSTEVFKVVAEEIVGSPDQFKYVKQAKIMGPAKIGTSSDSLIIYVMSTDQAVIQEIIKHLTDEFDETYFKAGGPMTMEQRKEKGVSYAERAPAGQSGSHGSSRSIPMAEAFVEMAQNAADENFASFFKRVSSKLESKGIDPNQPFKNK